MVLSGDGFAPDCGYQSGDSADDAIVIPAGQDNDLCRKEKRPASHREPSGPMRRTVSLRIRHRPDRHHLGIGADLGRLRACIAGGRRLVPGETAIQCNATPGMPVLRRASAALASGEECEPFEQVDVLFVFQQGAVQGRDRVLGIGAQCCRVDIVGDQ